MLDAVHLDEDMRGVLILASYRHNEVDAAHPLHTLIARWKRHGLPPRELHLENLRQDALIQMLGECLRLDDADAHSLGAAIRPLTGGNPFDTLELIDSLRRDGVLLLESEGWRWDEDRIHQHLEGRNVEALIAQRLRGIPEETTRLLDAMACVGGLVPLARLAVASGVAETMIAEQLAPALHEGLLIRGQRPAGRAVPSRPGAAGAGRATQRRTARPAADAGGAPPRGRSRAREHGGPRSTCRWSTAWRTRPSARWRPRCSARPRPGRASP